MSLACSFHASVHFVFHFHFVGLAHQICAQIFKVYDTILFFLCPVEEKQLLLLHYMTEFEMQREEKL